jgi:hypothetical protein
MKKIEKHTQFLLVTPTRRLKLRRIVLGDVPQCRVGLREAPDIVITFKFTLDAKIRIGFDGFHQLRSKMTKNIVGGEEGVGGEHDGA